MTADLTACVQWLVFGLCKEQGWGLGLLHKPGVFGNHIDKARELAFFSTTPKWHWKGIQGLRDCVAEKGLIPCVGCVWVY